VIPSTDRIGKEREMHAKMTGFVLMVLCVSAPATAQHRSDLSGSGVAAADIPMGVSATPTSVMGPESAIRQAGGTICKRSGDAVSVPPSTPVSPSRVQKARGSIAQVAWIAGVWIGTAEKAVVEERWTPAAGGSMLGIGRTLRDDVMSAFEFL
jgi:hypothetical protein